MTNQYFTEPRTRTEGANLWRRPRRAAFEVVSSSAEGTTCTSPGRTPRLDGHHAQFGSAAIDRGQSLLSRKAGGILKTWDLRPRLAHAVAPRLSNTAASELAYQICDCRRCPTVKRKGLSLLEVVLALAILAFATAYLSQSMQLAVQNAIRAERLTQAELVAESVLNQVIAGVIPSDPVTWTSYQNSSGVTDWMYQLQTVPTEVNGMIGLQVAVQKIDPAIGLVQTNFDLYANRWIIDPTLELDIPPATEEEVDSTGATSSSSAAGPPSAGSGTGAASQPANAGTIGGVGGGGFGGGGFGGGGFGGGAGGGRGGAGGGRTGSGGQGGAGGGRGGAGPGGAGGQSGGGPGGRGGAGSGAGGGGRGGAPGGGFSPGGPGGGAGFGGGGAGGGGFAPGGPGGGGRGGGGMQ